MITRQTSLSKNIVHFCRFLRLKGFAISVEEETIALNALQFIDYTSNTIFHSALKAVLCRSKAQLDEFDNLFNEYWKELEKAVDAKKKDEKGGDDTPWNSFTTLFEKTSAKSKSATGSK